jgi:DNA-binding transcriptional LysR family regulator
MDRFDCMRVFVAVVEAGGFSAAARTLGMPLATVSRKVSELEDQLRARLLIRTTRRVAPTEEGQLFFETSRRLLEELGEAERLVAGEYRAPRGELSVSAPIVLGRLHLTPIVTEFLAAYPEVDVGLHLMDRLVNMAEENIDVSLRIGHLPDSSLRAIGLGAIRLVVCASPAYLDAHGLPASPADLVHHHCVTFTALVAQKEWQFVAKRQTERFPVRSRLSVNTAEAAADAAIAGLGITRLLCYQVLQPIREGRLKLILVDYEPEPLPVHLIYGSAKLVPQKLKAFVDFVAPRLRPRLVFDP